MVFLSNPPEAPRKFSKTGPSIESWVRGTRVIVWIVLEQLEDGLTWDEIAREWDDKVGDAAIAETIAIAHLVVNHAPFEGFHDGAR